MIDMKNVKNWNEKKKIKLLKYVGDRLQKSRQTFDEQICAYTTVDVNETDFVVKVTKKEIGRNGNPCWNTYDCEVLYEEKEILAKFINHTLCIVKAEELQEFNNSEDNTIEEMEELANKIDKHCKDCMAYDCSSAGPNGDGIDDAQTCPNFTY